jgi:hypothetical protein
MPLSDRITSLHIYQFRIRGVASDLLRASFDDGDMSEQSGQTVMRTAWVDTADLYGLICRIGSMGLVLSPSAAGKRGSGAPFRVS